MPEITGITKPGEIYLCAEGRISAYAKRCLFADGVLLLEGKTCGSVRKTHVGKGLVPLSLLRDASVVNTGIVKPVHGGSGKIKTGLALSMRANVQVKSVVHARTAEAAAQMVYKPSEGRVLKPIYDTTSLTILLSHWGEFIPEISQPVMSHCTKKNFLDQKEVLIEVLKEYLGSHEFRGDRRNWLVARVKFKDCPIMYLLNGGWPGVYSPMRFIVDPHGYQHMIHYLFRMVKPDRGGESTYRYSLDGTTLDRIRMVQAEKPVDLTRMPPAIKELIKMYGDYDPVLRQRVYGVNQ